MRSPCVPTDTHHNPHTKKMIKMLLSCHLDVEMTWEELCELASEFAVDPFTGEIWVYEWKSEVMK